MKSFRHVGIDVTGLSPRRDVGYFRVRSLSIALLDVEVVGLPPSTRLYNRVIS
jgi:hypothetical protein